MGEAARITAASTPLLCWRAGMAGTWDNADLGWWASRGTPYTRWPFGPPLLPNVRRPMRSNLLWSNLKM